MSIAEAKARLREWGERPAALHAAQFVSPGTLLMGALAAGLTLGVLLRGRFVPQLLAGAVSRSSLLTLALRLGLPLLVAVAARCRPRLR